MYRTLTIAVATVTVVCATACDVALAAYEGPLWTINGTAVTGTTAVKAKSVGNIKLEDTKDGAIECKVSGEGKVSPEGKDEVTAATASECKGVKTCEASGASAKALNLPWKTQLQAVAGAVRDLVSSGGSGEPGWEIECKVLGIKVKDLCTGTTTEGVETVSEGVDVSADSKSADVNCSLGGAGTGVLTGTELDEDPAGTELAVADLYITATNLTGVADRGTKFCLFTTMGQECGVEFKNRNNFEVTISAEELIPTTNFSSRYGFLTRECTVNKKLLAQEGCIEKVELKQTPMPTWRNGIIVRITGGGRTGSASAFLNGA